MHMRHLINIIETPQMIGDFDFNLNSNETVASKLARLMDGTEEFITTYNTLKLYRKRYQIFAVDEKNRETPLAYWVKLADNQVFGVKGITQIGVWRDSASTRTKDLAKHVLFNVILPEFKVIITDAQQTADGRHFWILRVDDALASGLNVYLAHVMRPTKFVSIRSMDEFTEFSLSGEIWGTTQKFMTHKVIITAENLDDMVTE